MHERTRDFIVGLTTLLAVIIFGFLLLMFGELDEWVEPRYRVTFITDQAAGLRPGSPVQLNGVPIGVVDDVQYVQDRPSQPVEIRLAIEQNMLIPDDAIPYAATAILGGSSVLELDTGQQSSDSQVAYLNQDGSATLEYPMRFVLLEQLKAELQAQSEPFAIALQDIRAMSNVYTEVGEQISHLLEPQSNEQLAKGDPRQHPYHHYPYRLHGSGGGSDHAGTQYLAR